MQTCVGVRSFSKCAVFRARVLIALFSRAQNKQMEQRQRVTGMAAITFATHRRT